jgi:hypothetical protein
MTLSPMSSLSVPTGRRMDDRIPVDVPGKRARLFSGELIDPTLCFSAVHNHYTRIRLGTTLGPHVMRDPERPARL